jgi:protein-disulfide isomerase
MKGQQKITIFNPARIAFAFIMLAFVSQPLAAGTKEELQALKAEIETLQDGQEQIQKDLAEIKKLLQQGARAAPGQQAFKPVELQLGAVAYKGDIDAPVTLIEYSDYHCPFCRRHATTVFPQLLTDYVETGKVKFIMREYPIPNLHPRAVAASEAALCAGEQDAYWGMHDALFANQKSTTDENFREFAAGLDIDVAAFSECMDDDRHMAQIRRDQAEGQKLGVTGTPSFVLGRTDPEDSSKVNLTKFIRGAQGLPAFVAAIDQLLESEEDSE